MDQVTTTIKARVPASLTSLAPGGFVRARLAQAPSVLSMGQQVVAYDELEEAEADAVIAEFHGPVVYLRVDWTTRRDAADSDGSVTDKIVWLPSSQFKFVAGITDSSSLTYLNVIALGSGSTGEWMPRVGGGWQSQLPVAYVFDGIKHFDVEVTHVVPDTFNPSDVSRLARLFHLVVDGSVVEPEIAGGPVTATEDEALAG